jgi:hypothetical protein
MNDGRHAGRSAAWALTLARDAGKEPIVAPAKAGAQGSAAQLATLPALDPGLRRDDASVLRAP